MRPSKYGFVVLFDMWNISDASLGTEELGHLEMIGAIVHQLTRNLSDSQISECGFAPYFVDHTAGVYPTAASGFPFNAASMAVKGDPMADLVEDLAAEAASHYVQHRVMVDFRRSEKSLRRNVFSVFQVGDPISAVVDPFASLGTPITI